MTILHFKNNTDEQAGPYHTESAEKTQKARTSTFENKKTSKRGLAVSALTTLTKLRNVDLDVDVDVDVENGRQFENAWRPIRKCLAASSKMRPRFLASTFS